MGLTMALWKENAAPARPTPLQPFPEAKEPARYDAPPKPEAVNNPAAAPPARPASPMRLLMTWPADGHPTES